MIKECSQLKKLLSSFKKVSKGGKDNHSMIDYDSLVYNFDKVSKLYAKKYKINPPSTSDALYISDETNKIYLIEFKSGSIDKLNVLYKAYDSAIILQDLNIVNDFNYLRKNAVFILVYEHYKIYPNDFDSINRSRLTNIVRERAGKHKQLFDIKHIKNMLYSDVYTLTVNEFISKFGSTFDIKPT